MLTLKLNTVARASYAPSLRSSARGAPNRATRAPTAATAVTRTFFQSAAAWTEATRAAAAAKHSRKNLGTEFHRSSTRYTNTTAELLKIFSAQNTIPHRPPTDLSDKLAFKIVRFLRVASDMYFKDELVYRAMMLETVAAVPGMVGGMIHHLRSLRSLNNDNWINTLLEEAQNERAHLFAWLEVLKPTWSQRLLIVSVQAIFFTGFLAAYIVAPKTCHRFVGYLEEEAYKTYTHLLNQIDNGKVKDRPAPQLALDYWGLPEGATMRDMTVIIREDEADHARVNHTMANTLVKLRKRDIVYDEINVDDSFYAHLPGTAVDTHGQVKAISTADLGNKPMPAL